MSLICWVSPTVATVQPSGSSSEAQGEPSGEQAGEASAAMPTVSPNQTPVELIEEPPGRVPSETHCVVRLVGEGPEATSLGCHATRSAALTATLFTSATFAPRGSRVLGVHFSGRNFSGSSVTVTGSGCTGLVWRPGGGWDDNIESSYYSCGGPQIRFYDSRTCAGSMRPITGPERSLGWMSNRASCVRYG